MSAMFQCDECKAFYKSKELRKQHGKRSGHRIEPLQSDSAPLEDSLKAKDTEIATLQDTIKAKDADFATLHDEIAHLSSLEHEQDLVRNTLKGLTKEAYDLIGEQLGFTPKPATVEDSHLAENKEPAAAAPLADNKPKEKPESEVFIGKREGDGWRWFEALGFSVKEDPVK